MRANRRVVNVADAVIVVTVVVRNVVYPTELSGVGACAVGPRLDRYGPSAEIGTT